MKHIDELFKEKLYNHEAVVPEGMWEKIAPIAEEESGRAILWFWFAGLLALLLGGYGIYKMVYTNTSNPADPGNLVYQQEINNLSNNLVIDNSLTIQSNTVEEKDNSQLELEKVTPDSELKKTSPFVSVNKKHSNKEKHTISNTAKTIPIIESHTSQNISNTVESITNAVGIPANLVITKSYINKEGFVIKQSNLTDDSGNGGSVYDVIINSNSKAKDLNAGALLRIMEPLKNIPLPAFEKKLKKKTLNYPML